MEWRCEWCGKPQESNDPPCDNCGHGHFERAVRPIAPEGEGGPTVWICTECGRDHPRNNPPCSRCGGMDFERREQTYEDGDSIGPGVDVDDADATAVGDEAGAISGDEMVVWVCTECGRSHPRNNPPCSRCGNMQFERGLMEFDELETVGAGWLDALDWRVVLGFIGALALLALVVGTTLGLVSLPGGPSNTVPTDEVPGEAESAYGLDLASVESAYIVHLNERRADAGMATLEPAGALDRRATWYNRRVVQSEYTDVHAPTEGEVEDAFPDTDRCSYRIVYSPYRVDGGVLAGTPLAEYDSADAVAAALVDEYDRTYDGYNEASNGFVGVDVHVGPDDTVFVTKFVC